MPLKHDKKRDHGKNDGACLQNSLASPELLFAHELRELNETCRQVEKKAKAWAKATRTEKIEWQHTLPHLPIESSSLCLWIGVFYEHWQTLPKNQGVFYTPRPLARYLVRQTLTPFLERWKTDLLSRVINESDATKKTLAFHSGLEAFQKVRILDPAAGCGVFLSEALSLLTRFYDEVRESLNQHHLASLCALLPMNPAHFVLATNLVGVELDPVAGWICQWALVAQAQAMDGITLQAPVTTQIEIGNSLDDLRVFRDTLFDVILMNPPYTIEVRDNAKLFHWIRTESTIRESYQPKMDLADGFLLLAHRLLKPRGLVGALLPEYWLSRTQAGPIRQKYLTQMTPLELGLFGEQIWFSRAKGHHTSLLIAQKHEDQKKDEKNRESQTESDPPADKTMQVRDILLTTPELDCPHPGKILYFPHSCYVNVGDSQAIGLLEKIHQFERPLIQSDWIQQGVVLPQGRISLNLPEEVEEEKGVFLLSNHEVATLTLTPLEKAQLKPYYLPKQFKPGVGFQGQKPAYWLIYADQAFIQSIENFPNLKTHLDACSDWNTSDHRPYGLHRARQSHWFDSSVGSRLYGLRQTVKPCFSLLSETAYVNEGFYIISPPSNAMRYENEKDDHYKNAKQMALSNIESILNSPLFYFWACHQKRKGSRLQLDKDVLCRFPLPARLEKLLDSKLFSANDITKAYGLSLQDQQWLEAWLR